MPAIFPWSLTPVPSLLPHRSEAAPVNQMPFLNCHLFWWDETAYNWPLPSCLSWRKPTPRTGTLHIINRPQVFLEQLPYSFCVNIYCSLKFWSIHTSFQKICDLRYFFHPFLSLFSSLLRLRSKERHSITPKMSTILVTECNSPRWISNSHTPLCPLHSARSDAE